MKDKFLHKANWYRTETLGGGQNHITEYEVVCTKQACADMEKAKRIADKVAAWLQKNAITKNAYGEAELRMPAVQDNGNGYTITLDHFPGSHCDDLKQLNTLLEQKRILSTIRLMPPPADPNIALPFADIPQASAPLRSFAQTVRTKTERDRSAEPSLFE